MNEYKLSPCQPVNTPLFYFVDTGADLRIILNRLERIAVQSG